MTTQGVVKWLNETKGYGFVQRADGAEIFVHYVSNETEGFKTLSEGQAVEYDEQQSPKGSFAARVRTVVNQQYHRQSAVKYKPSARIAKRKVTTTAAARRPLIAAAVSFRRTNSQGGALKVTASVTGSRFTIVSRKAMTPPLGKAIRSRTLHSRLSAAHAPVASSRVRMRVPPSARSKTS